MTATILPSRAPSGSPVYAPTSRPVYRGGAAPGGAAAFDWTQFFGVGDQGFVFDGSQSDLWTTTGATTLCSTSDSDPVGLAEDMAGLSNLSQGTSNNKPVYYVNNGIRGFKAGNAVSRRWLQATVSGGIGAEFSFYVVERLTSTVGMYANSLLVKYGHPYLQVYRTIGGGTEYAFYDGANDVFMHVVSGASVGDIAMFKIIRRGTGANQTDYGSTKLSAFSVAGGTAATASTGVIATAVTPSIGGFYAGDSGPTEQYFAMLIDRALSAQEQLDIEAEILASLGGLT